MPEHSQRSDASPTTPSLELDPIERATWLTGSLLLLGGHATGEGLPAPAASLLSNEGSTPLESRCFSASSPDGKADALAPVSVLSVLVPDAEGALPSDATLVIQAGDRTLDLKPQDLTALTVDTKTFVRKVLAPLDATARTQALEFLAATLNAFPAFEWHELSETLFGIREGLRERLPATGISQGEQRGLHVDRLMAVDERSFYIEGWMHDPETAQLTAVSPEGSRCELLERLFWFPRPDVAKFLFSEQDRLKDDLGFICFFELDSPSIRADGWVLEKQDVSGTGELVAPSVMTDALEVRDTILNDPYIERLPNDELTANHVFPAIDRIQRKAGIVPEVTSVTQYGAPPESPDVSIVVPLYKQIQHLELQLSQFADDPELFEADLTYVLDSPEQREELLNYAADLFPIYRVPFRVAVLNRNAGFAGANNAGARLAEGRLLLLLNSDVLPDKPGWLSTLRDFYDATPGIGALCPKLLYEDDSIQHAGSYFYQLPGSSKWVDAHFYKGMHRSLPAANVARSVPVVSGACMMIDRALYEELGGLSGMYVQGDYEDSDLCLQLLQKGRENWYLPHAELYHLEGQSYTPDARRPANRYNMWLHTHLWAEWIATLTQGQDFAADAQAAQLSPSS